jgi:type II secretory pathway predicted ATPase ExeA
MTTPPTSTTPPGGSPPPLPDATRGELRRLRTHYHYAHAPFSKFAWAAHMYDSGSQKELLHGLLLWLEVRGIALVTGPSGVGKSITVRRFVQSLDEARFRVIDFSYLPTTPHGLLRSLNRKLGLPHRAHTADLFDQVQRHLVSCEPDTGAHPLLVLDDAEGLHASLVDVLRRLTVHELDGEDRFSILLAGTDALLTVLRNADLQPLVTRIVFAQQLRPFGLDDTRAYVRYQLERADVSPRLFTDDAVKRIFQTSQGKPRSINQIALQAMISAAVAGRDEINGDFLQHLLQNHPLYPSPGAAR